MAKIKVILSTTHKKCSKCGQWKLFEDYYHNPKKGYKQPCKECFKKGMAKYEPAKQEKQKQPKRADVAHKHQALRARARKAHVNYLTQAELRDWLESWEGESGTCYYCGRELSSDLVAGRKDLTLGCIDRMYPDDGYVPSNMVWTCLRCNFIKGNWFTPEETAEIASDYNLYSR